MTVSRRALLRLTALGAVAGFAPDLLASAGRQAGGTTDGGPETDGVSRGLWTLLSPVREGTNLGLGWRAGSLAPAAFGTFVLELTGDGGRRAEVRICRNSGTPEGMAHSTLLDFVVVNGGDGTVPTEESLGRVVIGLAETVARRERSEAVPGGPLASLRSHREWMALSGREPGVLS